MGPAAGGGAVRYSSHGARGECSAACGRTAGCRGPHAGRRTDFSRRWRTGGRQLRAAPDAASPLPFTGGWLLYLGYELAAEIEPRLRLPRSPDPVVALAIRAPAAWIRDRRRGQAWLMAEPGQEACSMSSRDDVRSIARRPASGPMQSLSRSRRTIPRRFSRRRAPRARVHRRGRCVPGQSVAPLAGTSARRARSGGVYQRLRATNPSPFAALLRDGDFAVFSSSPGAAGVHSGRYGLDPADRRDPAARRHARGRCGADRSLLGNEKERAEHVMLIDLERNDLGRVCAGGSVRVDEYMSVETYAHVHHIVSNVSGRLRNGRLARFE